MKHAQKISGKFLLSLEPKRGFPQKKMWDGKETMALGYPFRWVIERTEEGVRVRSLHAPLNKAYAGSVEELGFDSLQKPCEIVLDGAKIKLFPVTPLPPARILGAAGTARLSNEKIKAVLDAESQYFRKSLKSSFTGLAVLLGLAFLIPKITPKKEEELIPAKVAKLVLTQPRSTAAAPSQNQSTPQEKREDAPAPKNVAKAKDVAVVQAFRAKALQNAVSGLLKGGMTNLLQQSEMLMGADASKAARRMVDGKTVQGLPSAPVTGLTGARSVDVASIGGNGDPKSVGYGKGQKASVSGQGKSFVGLDLDNGQVEEGLTKDEVGKVIHAHMSEIRYCYESSMVRNPDVEGKLMLDFNIGPNGFVTRATVRESSLQDARLDDCIIRRLTKWAFPKPKGGVNVAVAYPFIFKTLGR